MKYITLIKAPLIPFIRLLSIIGRFPGFKQSISSLNLDRRSSKTLSLDTKGLSLFFTAFLKIESWLAKNSVVVLLIVFAENLAIILMFSKVVFCHDVTTVEKSLFSSSWQYIFKNQHSEIFCNKEFFWKKDWILFIPRYQKHRCP